ncbi:hypothetical protein [uncultured Roseibium sp.]|uniref:hypothetical protein n=1 Tax=uncultured Roseibium sp. TaxID=1936171 RepID=UPI0026023EE7|nr:hypothetical protein [uncultured Roseibium sp.]
MTPDLREQIQKMREKGLSEEKINETVHMVTSLMEPFADAAWGRHSIQMIQDEKNKNMLGKTAGYARIDDISKTED